MAIYHLNASTVSRGTASAKSRYEYIKREGRYKSDHAEVTYSQSGNMPKWAEENPRAYWDGADTYERGNGRLFKQLEFALPKELSQDQQKELVQEYVSKVTTTKDGPLPYSFAIHKGHDRENPHCHLMISERVNDGYARSQEKWFKRANGKKPDQGGAKKTLELRPKEWLHKAREEWSLHANRALEQAGHAARIDHRSLQDQGIDREPTQHLGPVAAAMERKGVATDRGRQFAQADPTRESQIAKELETARKERDFLTEGISQARARFTAEKEKRAQEAELRKIAQAKWLQEWRERMAREEEQAEQVLRKEQEKPAKQEEKQTKKREKQRDIEEMER